MRAPGMAMGKHHLVGDASVCWGSWERAPVPSATGRGRGLGRPADCASRGHSNKLGGLAEGILQKRGVCLRADPAAADPPASLCTEQAL